MKSVGWWPNLSRLCLISLREGIALLDSATTSAQSPEEFSESAVYFVGL